MIPTLNNYAAVMLLLARMGHLC